jgi:hypothetical protein
MSIEVRVPDEIADYKESLVAGLSIRQLVCGGVALLCGVPTYLLLHNFSQDLATYATMLVVAPSFCVGFIKRDGYPFEVWLKIRIYNFLSKSKRGYETDVEANSLPIEVEAYRKSIQEYLKSKDMEDMENNMMRVQDKKARGEHSVWHRKEKSSSRGVKNKTRTEYEFVEISAKTIKRKRKTAAKTIKTTARKHRTKKPKEEKEIKGRSRTEKLSTDFKI